MNCILINTADTIEDDRTVTTFDYKHIIFCSAKKQSEMFSFSHRWTWIYRFHMQLLMRRKVKWRQYLSPLAHLLIIDQLNHSIFQPYLLFFFFLESKTYTVLSHTILLYEAIKIIQWLLVNNCRKREEICWSIDATIVETSCSIKVWSS